MRQLVFTTLSSLCTLHRQFHPRPVFFTTHVQKTSRLSSPRSFLSSKPILYSSSYLTFSGPQIQHGLNLLLPLYCNQTQQMPPSKPTVCHPWHFSHSTNVHHQAPKILSSEKSLNHLLAHLQHLTLLYRQGSSHKSPVSLHPIWA